MKILKVYFKDGGTHEFKDAEWGWEWHDFDVTVYKLNGSEEWIIPFPSVKFFKIEVRE